MIKNHIQFWKNFYKIRYYQSITKKQTVAEIKFLKEFLPQSKYKNILDFICGFGRHSLELAKAGYNVEGFDIDRNSINKARSAIKKFNLININLYVKDAMGFQKRNVFDAAACLYSSIGFLDSYSNEKIFKNLLRSVKIGGRIIIDVMNPRWAIKNLKPFIEKTTAYQGIIYKIKHQRKIINNPLREKNQIVFLNTNNNRKYKIFYVLRLFSLDEIRQKLKKYHFKIYKEFGSFNKAVISSKNQRIIIIADKNKFPGK